jgi:hypothetical protein
MFNPVAESIAKMMEPAQTELQQTLRAILAEQSKTVAILHKIALALAEEPEPSPPPANLRAIKTPRTKEKPS